MTLKEQDLFRANVRGVQQQDINRFGVLHGTTGKTHTDPEYALRNGFGGVIVQGALVMAPVMDMCSEILGDRWFDGCEIEAKFVAYTRPGDPVSVQFVVQKSEPELVQLTYSCMLSNGKVVQVGTVTWRAT